MVENKKKSGSGGIEIPALPFPVKKAEVSYLKKRYGWHRTGGRDDSKTRTGRA